MWDKVKNVGMASLWGALGAGTAIVLVNAVTWLRQKAK